MSTGPGCTDPAELAASVAAFCRAHGLLPRDGRVAVAFSGGPDSTALLHVLSSLCPGRVEAVHVDHGLVDGSSVLASAAAALAERIGVVAHVVEVAVEPRLVRERGLEAAARDARYAALSSAADGLGAGVCAVGHTADDRAETVLMNLMRGSGLDGLAAMRPRRGRFVRPMLGCRRAGTSAYCAAVGLDPVPDPSNADPAILRNRVRAELVPLLEDLRPGALGRIADTAARLERDADYLAEVAAGAAGACASSGHDHVAFDVPALAALPAPVGARVVRAGLARLLDGEAPPAAATAGVLRGHGGHLQGTPLWSRREGDELVVRRSPAETHPVGLPSAGVAEVSGRRVAVRACPPGVQLSARPLADGDRIAGRRRTLRDVLARAGAQRRVRDEALTILADDEIAGVAAPGLAWLGLEGIEVEIQEGGRREA